MNKKTWGTMLFTLIFICSFLTGNFIFWKNIHLKTPQNSENNKSNKHKIMIDFKVLDNLPIIKDYVLPKLISFEEEKLNLLKIFSTIKIDWDIFDITKEDLFQKIETDTVIFLEPQKTAIAYISRFKVKINDFLRIGITKIDSEKIVKCLRDKRIKTSEEIITKLKIILLTKKQRFIKIIYKFIIF